MSRRNRKQASTERVGVVAVVLVLGQTRGSSRHFRVLRKQRLPARALIQQQRVIFSGNRRPTDPKRLALLSQVHANRISSAKSPVLLRNAQNVLRVRWLWFRPTIHPAQQKRRFVPEKNLVRRLSRSRRLPAGRSRRRYFLRRRFLRRKKCQKHKHTHTHARTDNRIERRYTYTRIKIYTHTHTRAKREREREKQ